MNELAELRRENARLKDRVEELEAEIAWLTDDDPTLHDAARILGCGAVYAEAALAFCRRSSISHEHLLRLRERRVAKRREGAEPRQGLVEVALCGHYPSVILCHLRKVLKPHGIAIANVWGWGYRIDPANQARLRALLHVPLARGRLATREAAA